jgi:SpoVK/Ycf46/Vps4 family AAA+-type ATPase
LDFGRVFSKYVGDSESRVRSALKMIEQMAPCVLFADEIDKGLGGSGGGGDSGTSSRVLGSYLTWLQECKAPVFNVVTANRVQGLPPELFRRGRFDKIFSVTMPNPKGREEVLRIHLRKRGRDLDNFEREDIQAFLDASEGYVPAEIEAAVKDAITESFADVAAEDLEMRHLIAAIKDMIPLSKSHASAMEEIKRWAEANATPVEYTEQSPDPKLKVEPVPARPVGRVIRTRR